MACSISRFGLRRAIQSRRFSQCVPSSSILTNPVCTSTLSNRLIVASVDNNSPITRVSVQFRAGSRNETADNAGVTHIMRIAAGLSTLNASQFAITRNVQQLGATLYCVTDREAIAYTLEGLPDVVEQLLPYLGEVSTQQAFKPWELVENWGRVKVELATRPPQQRAIDLLHKAAYRRGLGNSIYIAKSQLGKIDSETLKHYMASTFTAGRCAVVGTGINHDTLCSWAGKLSVPEGTGETAASPYKGGEIRSDKGGDLAFITLATEGSGFTKKEALGLCVLKYALGSAPSVKYGQSSSILAKAAGSGGHGISAFNITYSDSGLFGIFMATEAEQAGKLIESVLKSLKNVCLTDNDLKRGINQKKMELISMCESCDSLDFIARQALLTGNVVNCNDLLTNVESITVSDVQKLADKIVKGKWSMASVGNLRSVPFLDELR